ncbi:MAG TPA: anti-sigma factor, partial [Acidimicrobiales bacterium]
CPACRAEVSGHREVASMLAHTGATAPDGLWDRISASLEETPPALRLAAFAPPGEPAAEEAGAGAAPVTSLAAHRERRVRLSAFVGVAAAAVIAVLALGIVVVRQNSRLDHVNSALSKVGLQQVVSKAMNDRGFSHAHLQSTDGKVSVPAVVTPQGVGYLVTTNLPTLRAGRTYQLWGVRGKHVVSLGIFTAGADAVPFQTNGPLDALAITDEVEGGVATSSNQPVVAGKVV